MMQMGKDVLRLISASKRGSMSSSCDVILPGIHVMIPGLMWWRSTWLNPFHSSACFWFTLGHCGLCGNLCLPNNGRLPHPRNSAIFVEISVILEHGAGFASITRRYYYTKYIEWKRVWSNLLSSTPVDMWGGWWSIGVPCMHNSGNKSVISNISPIIAASHYHLDKSLHKPSVLAKCAVTDKQECGVGVIMSHWIQNWYCWSRPTNQIWSCIYSILSRQYYDDITNIKSVNCGRLV